MYCSLGLLCTWHVFRPCFATPPARGTCGPRRPKTSRVGTPLKKAPHKQNQAKPSKKRGAVASAKVGSGRGGFADESGGRSVFQRNTARPSPASSRSGVVPGWGGGEKGGVVTHNPCRRVPASRLRDEAISKVQVHPAIFTHTCTAIACEYSGSQSRAWYSYR